MVDYTALSLTGLIVMIGTWLFHRAANIPQRGLGWIRRQFVIEIEVFGNDPLFGWLQTWLSAQPYSLRCRGLVAITRDEMPSHHAPIVAQSSSAASYRRRRPTISLVPAPGEHFFIHRNRPLWISRKRDKPGGDGNVSYSMFIESITIRTFGRDRSYLLQVLEDARDFALIEATGLQIYVASYDYWRELGYFPRRPRESVVLPEGQFEALEQDVRTFLNRSDWYASMGVPYRRGYLLHGTPGSGKTSSILALASLLDTPLYILDLASSMVTDSSLVALLNSVPTGAFVLIEDIDAAFDGRTKDEASKSLSFSGLLNAIDGAASGFGRILFMTTNHLDRLDSALTRPGRCDVTQHYGPATAAQLEKLYLRFFPERDRTATSGFVARFNDQSMAAAQEFLLNVSNQAAVSVCLAHAAD